MVVRAANCCDAEATRTKEVLVFGFLDIVITLSRWILISG